MFVKCFCQNIFVLTFFVICYNLYPVTRGIFYLFILMLTACATGTWTVPSEFLTIPITAGKYEIFTYQRLSDRTSPVHIYIEGDGNSFTARGTPTRNPTPRGTFMRDLVSYDTSPNVVYMARPCQYIMSPACRTSDWTDGRFSTAIIDSMSSAIRQIAENRPIVLIGYSGGALVSGLVIARNPDMDVEKWITIAGVLNHQDWTEYFDDAPLTHSLDLNELPHVSQYHYAAPLDRVVPNSLSERWTMGQKLIYVPGATHTSFPVGNILF